MFKKLSIKRSLKSRSVFGLGSFFFLPWYVVA